MVAACTFLNDITIDRSTVINAPIIASRFDWVRQGFRLGGDRFADLTKRTNSQSETHYKCRSYGAMRTATCHSYPSRSHIILFQTCALVAVNFMAFHSFVRFIGFTTQFLRRDHNCPIFCRDLGPAQVAFQQQTAAQWADSQNFERNLSETSSS